MTQTAYQIQRNAQQGLERTLEPLLNNADDPQPVVIGLRITEREVGTEGARIPTARVLHTPTTARVSVGMRLVQIDKAGDAVEGGAQYQVRGVSRRGRFLDLDLESVELESL